MTQVKQLVSRIAREHLLIPTLETQRSDHLDFHEVAVWAVEAALIAAYQAGRDSAEVKATGTDTPLASCKQEAAMNNAERAIRLEVAILALREEYGDDPCEILIDLLTDARHWCDQQGEDFARLDRIAYQHYLAELNEDRAAERRMP